MVYVRVHRLTTGAVSSGSSKEDTWKSDAKYTLREVLIVARGGSDLSNVQFYADIDGVPFFRPDVPAALLLPRAFERVKVGLAFAKGSSFNYKLTNNSGVSETYDIGLVLETEVWPPA
jgi:hypothetical protein